MRRREFLKYGSGLVILAAAGGATRLAGAQVPPLEVVEEFTYRGRNVQIVKTPADVLLVFVDGRELAAGALIPIRGNRFVSTLLPFQPQPTPGALVRSLLDNDGRLFIL